MSDFNITLFEACEILNRSKKSISRYIRKGRLHPEQIKSQQGTLEYRFSRADLEALKVKLQEQATRDTGDGTQAGQPEQTMGTINKDIGENKTKPEETAQQPSPDTPRETAHDNEVKTLLKETTEMLKDQLHKKDEQIKDLSGKIDQFLERSRETNIILKSLQDRILMLEQPKETINNQEQTGQPITADQPAHDEPKVKKTGFWQRLFKKD